MRDHPSVRLGVDYLAMDVAIPDGDQGSRKVDRESQLGGVEGVIRGRLVFDLA
jgi:hypothetical protein